ncbi:class I SAM-dependent methyltransferase [Frankia tisae]|uniref:class I SAM-dependent methyltransferase n=1 Tax=Frankia tisae TaxID=2950104 RepID=UPI0021C022E8|nr:class I SAM-dependent methyltransferase [Frankia tisae]
MNTIGTDMYQDGTYLSRHPDWHDGDGAWKATQIARLLARNSLYPQSVCDVGCGTGRVLTELATHLPGAIRLLGVDTSPAVLEIARERVRDRVCLTTVDAMDPQERFDLLLMIDVFEHVEDYLGFLRAFCDRATRFVFHVPLDMTVQTVGRMGPIMRARRNVGHLHYFSRETALATLQDAGYRVLDEAYTPGGLELPGRGRGQRVARLPRSALYRARPHLAARLLGGFSLLVLGERA